MILHPITTWTFLELNKRQHANSCFPLHLEKLYGTHSFVIQKRKTYYCIHYISFTKNEKRRKSVSDLKPTMVAHTYSPSHSGG